MLLIRREALWAYQFRGDLPIFLALLTPAERRSPINCCRNFLDALERRFGDPVPQVEGRGSQGVAH